MHQTKDKSRNVVLLFLLQLSSLEQAVSVVQQVAYALAVGECSCLFEHRDLHWGNVLVKPCGTRTEIKGLLHGRPFSLASSGVRVAVIDFTLSRLSHTRTLTSLYDHNGLLAKTFLFAIVKC